MEKVKQIDTASHIDNKQITEPPKLQENVNRSRLSNNLDDNNQQPKLVAENLWDRKHSAAGDYGGVGDMTPK